MVLKIYVWRCPSKHKQIQGHVWLFVFKTLKKTPLLDSLRVYVCFHLLIKNLMQKEEKIRNGSSPVYVYLISVFQTLPIRRVGGNKHTSLVCRCFNDVSSVCSSNFRENFPSKFIKNGYLHNALSLSVKFIGVNAALKRLDLYFSARLLPYPWLCSCTCCTYKVNSRSPGNVDKG